MNTHWKGAYGYDTKHSIYSDEFNSKVTTTDIGVGTRQQTPKKCGIVKQQQVQELQKSSYSSSQCESGTCPWR